MNNLHRELAPMSAAAWADLEDEARRTFKRHVAGRRVVDVPEAGGSTLAAVSTGHLQEIAPPADGIQARVRGSQALVELRAPFAVDRQQVDDVERGAKDADWEPVKEAAKRIAFAEDRLVFDGYAAAGIVGLRNASSNPSLTLPAEVRDYPNAIAQAVSALRLAGVDGPYSLALSAEAYTAASETSDHGYPISEHIARLLDGEIVWAPAIDGAVLASTRGGDFELSLGQDLSIGYLSHDDADVQLYFVETLTFVAHTAEAAVVLTSGSSQTSSRATGRARPRSRRGWRDRRSSTAPGSRAVGDAPHRPAQDLARAGLRQAGDHHRVLERRDRPDLARGPSAPARPRSSAGSTFDARLQHDEPDAAPGPSASSCTPITAHSATSGCVGDHLLHRAGREPVAGDVDDVVDATHHEQVAVLVDVAAVAGEVVAREASRGRTSTKRSSSFHSVGSVPGRERQLDRDRALARRRGTGSPSLVEDLDVVARARPWSASRA